MTVIAFSIALPALILFTWARLLRFTFLNVSGLGDGYSRFRASLNLQEE